MADEIGLLERDIIVSINRRPVSGIEDVRRVQSSLKPGDAVAFRVMRPGQIVRTQKGQYNSFYLTGTLPVTP